MDSLFSWFRRATTSSHGLGPILDPILEFLERHFMKVAFSLSMFIFVPVIAWILFWASAGEKHHEVMLVNGVAYSQEQIDHQIKSGAIKKSDVVVTVEKEPRVVYGADKGKVKVAKALLLFSWFYSVVMLMVAWGLLFLVSRVIEKAANYGKERVSPVTVRVMLQKVANVIAWICVVNLLLAIMPFEDYNPYLLLFFVGFFIMAALMRVGWIMDPPKALQRIVSWSLVLAVGVIVFVVGMSPVMPNTSAQYNGSSADGVSARGAWDNFWQDMGIAGKRTLHDVGGWVVGDDDKHLRNKAGRPLVNYGTDKTSSRSSKETSDKELRQLLQDL